MLGIENIALDKVVRLGLKLERHCFEDFLRHKKYNMRVNHASQVDCTGLQRTNSGVVREQPTLPEGQEDDRLDGEELEDRVEGLKLIPTGEKVQLLNFRKSLKA